jgi:murein L,D-transpeptidase YcbB/YkuD
MKLHEYNKISHSIKLLAISVFFCFSCQHKITQTEPSEDLISKSVEVYTTPVEKFFEIDTSNYSLAHRVSLLPGLDVEGRQKLQNKINRFYTENLFKTKWLEETSPNILYHTFITQLKGASQYGLNPAEYEIGLIEEMVNQLYSAKTVSVTQAINADITITELFFIFATHLKYGRIDAMGNNKNVWFREKRTETNIDITLLAKSKAAHQLLQTIDSLQPSSAQYANLKKALAFYRSLEKLEPSTLSAIRGNEKIKPGDRHVMVPVMRRKLGLVDMKIYEVDDDSTSGYRGDSLRYDQILLAGVKAFQERHGLQADGIVGGKTLKFLNQSFKEKADIIALNMERIRWSTDNYDNEQYIHVNIPEYILRIFTKKVETLRMKVIVGAVDNATPVFRETLEHIVFSPTWTVPPSIIKEEFLPRLKRNPMSYNTESFSFYKSGVIIDPALEPWDSAVNINQYRIVQKSGRNNSLGLVKFVMPNDMNIYLHDTPDHTPFSKTFRALSHGCIRLDDPARFAEYLLKDQIGWDLSTIKKAMNAKTSTTVLLTNQYPVYITYQTSWVDDRGQINFREDIYGHDKRQLQLFLSKEAKIPVATL